MKKISAVINARLLSSRMKNKMIRPYNGTDLLDIALDKLNQLDYFDNRYFAVAEDSLIKRAEKYKNIEILKREPQSVEPGPHHPMVTFEHYTRIPTEYFFVMNACSAFLSLDTIKKAYDFFQKTEHRTYISVVETRDWIFSNNGKALTHTDPDALQNTSDGQIYYRASHSFYIANRNYFIENNGKLWTLNVNDPCLITMPVEESFDVDTDIDFKVSEYLYGIRNQL